MAIKNFDVTIHRKRKHEAEQAIRDLEERGYFIISELTNKKEDRKIFSAGENRRFIFQDTAIWDSWHCRMRRVVNDD